MGSDSLHKLMEKSDYLVVAAPLTEETRGMVNAEAFQHAKSGLILINLGRGPVINEAAMIEALKSATIGGAALDVFSVEPLPDDSVLWDIPNILLSPHNADMTVDFQHKSVQLFCRNCHRFIAGETLLCEVNKSAGY